jgi:hypothetical protein
MHPAEARSRQTGVSSRTVKAFCSGGLVRALVVSLLAFAPGCGRPPARQQDDAGGGGAKVDPWDAAAKRLRKDTDPVACKAVLASLNLELAGSDKVEKPPVLTPEAEKALATVVPLSGADRDEIRPGTFSPHDPVYLAECLYLRDAARSLALPGLSPEQLADLGFAWVCRHVYLDPWIVPPPPGTPPHLVFQKVEDGRAVFATGTALPPAYVLRRGYGSGLERMYVFLALLRQAGLDGCLVGPPEARDQWATHVVGTSDGQLLTGGARGPFWAVGVRVEKEGASDVRLYDPWRGQAFPATLNQLRADPEAHKAWFDDRANASGVTVDDARKVAVYLAAPVNALSPRMALLERKLKDQVDVRLAVDPAAVRGRFPDPKPAYWNPADDRFAHGRAARTFLPADMGGADRADPRAGRLYDHYLRSQLPPAERVVPAELLRNRDLVENVKERIATIAGGAYVLSFLTPPTPREQIQRGRFQDAARTLVERADEFSKSLERVRNTPGAEKQMREWAERATELYRSLTGDPGTHAALDAHWRSQAGALVLDRAVGEMGQAEASFLLALGRHEQAERAQSRLEHAPAGDAGKLREAAARAWSDAVREWNSYREQYAEAHAAAPGRAAHVRTLSDRAAVLARRR